MSAGRGASMEFVTNSPEETEELGERLGRALSPGDVVAFTGDLGAGKTAVPPLPLSTSMKGGGCRCSTSTCTA